MRRHLLILVVPLMLGVAPARGDTQTDAEAKQRFLSASQAYREARYKEAIDLFLQANRLSPHAELIFNVGQSYEKLGDVPDALRSYREYLRLAPTASDRATVEASIRNLEARLREKGVQQVSIFSTPPGASIVLDQKVVGQTPWTGEIAPGHHLALLRAQGYPDTAKEFMLAADRSMDLDIALSTKGTAATVIPTADGAATGAPDAPRRARVAPWTIAALSVGVAGLGAALGLEIARKSAESDAKADPTQIGYSDKLSTMQTRATAARAMLGIGIGVTAVGGALLVVDLTRGGDAPKKVGLGCFDGGCGAFAGGRF